MGNGPFRKLSPQFAGLAMPWLDGRGHLSVSFLTPGSKWETIELTNL